LAQQPQLPPSWLAHLQDEFNEPYMLELKRFLLEEKKHHTIYPSSSNMFNAFQACPFEQVKVVILGQDPYHGPDQAHGLSFSVEGDVPAPPSLVNIFKEIESDCGWPRPQHGNLQAWAQQGVFLLNTVLTVRHKTPQSHAGKGWETFTDKVISVLNANRKNLVFCLWGAPARKKTKMIDTTKHHILEAPHPSPLSAYRGFLGCRHFSKANAILEKTGQMAIDWKLPEKR
jgi:uracil-DNA glycosylase